MNEARCRRKHSNAVNRSRPHGFSLKHGGPPLLRRPDRTRMRQYAPRCIGRGCPSNDAQRDAMLEVETEFGGEGSGGDVVCSRESGEEVVERVLVGEVDGGEPQAPLLLVA